MCTHQIECQSLPSLTPQTRRSIGSKNQKPSYLYNILLSTQHNPFHIINAREKYIVYSTVPKTICNALKNGNEIQTNGAKGEWMNNDPLLCQHDNSHVWEFADRDWLRQWKSAGASN